ncbi:hypothetical protein [uncultured Bacteroides sp.]|uniref:hypothetical protein n=1 Tax=uncultured Bacteroides sp. TaxID=162156 RepID=UPI0025FA2344|nr:hypothetical protein [uncultured Bacteroides sp.]
MGDATTLVHSSVGSGFGSGSGVGVVPLSSLQAARQSDIAQNRKKEINLIFFIPLDFQIIIRFKGKKEKKHNTKPDMEKHNMITKTFAYRADSLFYQPRTEEYSTSFHLVSSSTSNNEYGKRVGKASHTE